MAKKTETEVTPETETPNIQITDLAAAFAAGMKQALEQVQPPKPFDQYEYNQRPENIDPATTLKRTVLQHGHPLNIWGCTQATLDHLNELEPGEYLGGRVKVLLIGRPPHEKLNIEYPWDTVQARMQNQSLFSSFSDLVQKINQEQKAKAAKSN